MGGIHCLGVCKTNTVTGDNIPFHVQVAIFRNGHGQRLGHFRFKLQFMVAGAMGAIQRNGELVNPRFESGQLRMLVSSLLVEITLPNCELTNSPKRPTKRQTPATAGSSFAGAGRGRRVAAAVAATGGLGRASAGL